MHASFCQELIVLPGTCVWCFVTYMYFNLSPIYHLCILFVEISYQARFCLQISCPAVLCIMLMGFLKAHNDMSNNGCLQGQGTLIFQAYVSLWTKLTHRFDFNQCLWIMAITSVPFAMSSRILLPFHCSFWLFRLNSNITGHISSTNIYAKISKGIRKFVEVNPSWKL